MSIKTNYSNQHHLKAIYKKSPMSHIHQHQVIKNLQQAHLTDIERHRKTTDVAKPIAQKKIEQDNEEGKTYKTTAKAFVRRPKKTVEIKVRQKKTIGEK